MSDLNNNKKEFNLPSYVNIPFFLYQDIHLDRPALLIAAFFYSLHSAGLKLTASTDYLCQLASIKKRQLYNIFNQLEELNYVRRTGFTNKKKIHWIHQPKSDLTVTEKDTSASHCTSVQKLNTSAIQCSKLVQSSAVNLCTPVHTDNKEYIKENNKPPLTPRSASLTSERLFFFSLFLSFFPAVKNKTQCQKLWIKNNLEAQGEMIVNRVKEALAHDDQWKRGFYPGALNYLKNEGWNDDIIQAKPDLDNIKKLETREEAKKRVEQQERLSIANAEHEKIKALAKKDGKIFKTIAKEVITNPVDGFNALKRTLGMSSHEKKLEKSV